MTSTDNARAVIQMSKTQIGVVNCYFNGQVPDHCTYKLFYR